MVSEDLFCQVRDWARWICYVDEKGNEWWIRVAEVESNAKRIAILGHPHLSIPARHWRLVTPSGPTQMPLGLGPRD